MRRRFEIPRPGEEVDPEYVVLLDRLQRSAMALDGCYRVPLTGIRFGLDPIVGLVPIAGDLVMGVLSFRLIGLARRLGASPRALWTMSCNSLVDIALGMVPLAGPVVDVFFRANLRNLKLLLDEIASRRGSVPVERPAVSGVAPTA